MPNSFRKILFAFLLSAFCLVGSTDRAYSAFTAVWVTSAGATNNGGDAVNAEATFTLNGNSLTITLKNLLVDQMNAGQNVTGIIFDTVGGGGTTTLIANSGIIREFASKSSWIDTPTSETGWRFTGKSTTTTGTQLTLDWFNRDKTVLPETSNNAEYTLIGMPGTNNVYNNANGSLITNPGHNPFLSNPLVFQLTLPAGVTDIAGVTLEFGTTRGDQVNLIKESVTVTTTEAVAPAPSSAIAALSGLAVFGLIGFSRIRRRPRPVLAA